MHAGPLSLHYDEGEIRDIRLGSVEVVRRVYPVFQDRNWTARPWVLEDEVITSFEGGFHIAACGRGTFDATPLEWSVDIDGSPDGEVVVAFSAIAHSAFWRNRLGLCVLHPVRDLAGTEVIVEHTDGALESSTFPTRITPHQPFTNLRALTHEVIPGVHATVRMEGDIFESEDHRNWSDASYKHYCTPIDLPFPVEVLAGSTIAQRVSITLSGAAAPPPGAELRIDTAEAVVPIPELGIQLDRDGHRLTDVEIARLRELCLAHLRVDLHPGDCTAALHEAVAAAEAIGAPLSVALNGVDPREVGDFRDHPMIDRWLIFDPMSKVTDPQLVEDARAVLGPRVVGGTNLYFTELNRGRPTSGGFITFSANPQVHAWDDRTVMQNAWTLGEIAREARTLYPQSFIELSPLTLRPRWNPNATTPELDVSSTPLPSTVDSRQCTQFAAAWLVLALGAITAASALDSVTLFAATGWEGLMERAEGSPQPEEFPSRPGEPFPVFTIVRAIAGAKFAHPVTSSDPDVATALALAGGPTLVANGTPYPQRPLVDGIALDLPPYGVVAIERRTS